MAVAVPPAVRRWLIPTAAALAVIGGGVAVGAITEAADNGLPPRSAQELLTDVLTAHTDGLSGTLVVRVDLGLPELPIAKAGSADLSSLAAGSHTLRIWYSSPQQARVALLGTAGESDIITDGTQLWIWSSKTNTATHATLPAGGLSGLLSDLPGILRGAAGGGTSDGGPSALPSLAGVPSLGAGAIAGGGFSPDGLAKLALTFLGQSTDITTEQTTVAGRSAYELVLRPKDPATLIGAVRIAVDAAQHFPLRLAIDARDGGSPVIEVGFTEVSFSRPDAGQFTFNPPPGAKVVEAGDDLPLPGAGDANALPLPDSSKSKDGSAPARTVGSGWTTVIVAPLPEQARSGSGLSTLLALLPRKSGDWGSGSLLTSRLVNVLITDDGRVLIGAVTPDALYQAAK
jgi:outer membrane lipoprotein-sorting protein